MQKPSIPEGVRDFSPEQVFKRNYLFDVIKKVFLKYGFQPIETPTMEKLSTLTGKYGEEGDRLLYKIRSNKNLIPELKFKMTVGAFEEFSKLYPYNFIPKGSENGMRYDLTVPFARYVVMHQNEIAFPFKRYQIQPVWRGDRAQRGRYREFYQCDVDVVGSNSLMYEAELVQIYDEVFRELDLNVVIKVNNRKVLEGIAEAIGAKDKFMDMTIAIDKLDKIAWEGVEKELIQRGFEAASIQKLQNILAIKDLATLKVHFAQSEIGLKGIAELEAFHKYLDKSTLTNEVAFDITLARGLTYYTGCIFEVSSKDAKMGSIGGGGRYDDLTGIFGLKGVSGVGVSFGAERIFDIMEELGKFPTENQNQVKVFFVAEGEAQHFFAFECVTALRKAGINADIYPEAAKFKKQMEYVLKRNFEYVAIIEQEELEAKKVKFRNMKTKAQEILTLDELIEKIKQ